MTEIRSQLREIITSVTKVKSDLIGDDDDLIAKHGVDSMQRIEILIAMEKAFGVEVPDEEATHLRTLSDFCNLVKKYTN